MTDLRFPRFPEPDDIGRDLAAGHRRQVLLAAEQEAEDWAAYLPTGPARQEQELAVIVLRELREQEAA
jgi:hypothetical protein